MIVILLLLLEDYSLLDVHGVLVSQIVKQTVPELETSVVAGDGGLAEGVLVKRKQEVVDREQVVLFYPVPVFR